MAHSSKTDGETIRDRISNFDYIVNPGPKTPVTGLKAAVSTDNAIVTETMLKVLREGGNAIDAGIAGCLLQGAVEPFMTNHTGTVTCLFYEAATGQYHLQMDGQIGVIAPGAIADLIVVDGDPLEDIQCLGRGGANFPIIMQAGRFHKREL